MAPRRTPNDSYPTETSELQAATEDTLLRHLPSEASQAASATADHGSTTTTATGAGAAKLQRNAHLQFLARHLIQGFPARYTSQDASQPWLVFWTVQGLSFLQVGLDPGNKQRAIDTIVAWQHPEGGFGGGPGQAAHLLPTYAAVCALANVGRLGPGGGWDQIDRDKMYRFFMSLKQPDGSFLVAHHAEVDVRGVYCLLVTATLLDILTPELVRGTAAFVASCQTYEGGFASASQPYYDADDDPTTMRLLLSAPRPPLGEAHGGYTFCALAAWVILQPLLRASGGGGDKHHVDAQVDAPVANVDANANAVNLGTALRWLSHMQGGESELGGFKGRTNKLVDGCYAWWVGASFALLEALGVGGSSNKKQDAPDRDRPPPRQAEAGSDDDDAWDDVDDTLLNRKALQEYILYAGQHPSGGLRDKPPKSPDSYHTLYCLAGLSAAQHHVYSSAVRREELERCWTPSSSGGDADRDAIRKTAFVSSLCWTEEEGTSKYVGGPANRVNATHPVFNLTLTHTEAMMAHFYGQVVPKRPFRAASS